MTQKVKSAKGRKRSSTLWLERQLNDPYVSEAKARGYRSRAAFKLLEMNDKLSLLWPGARVVDLGAAPGGWTQVAVEAVNARAGGKGPRGQVLAIDLQEMEPIDGATCLHLDFMDEDAEAEITRHLSGPVTAVLSDMAAPATGHAETDHLRIMGLCETAFAFACQVLAPGGVFVAKVLQGGTEITLLNEMKRRFRKVRHIKPPASRADSAEMYVVGEGFRDKPGT